MKKVLILESNETFAKELSAYFEKEGYTVCGVSGDGTEGLALLEKQTPNVVVTSLLLTGVDGFTVMERAKKSGVKADFIVLGNFADDKIINRAIALGARYYLMKPVEDEKEKIYVPVSNSDARLRLCLTKEEARMHTSYVKCQKSLRKSRGREPVI